jgi:hypothetical protein
VCVEEFKFSNEEVIKKGTFRSYTRIFLRFIMEEMRNKYVIWWLIINISSCLLKKVHFAVAGRSLRRNWKWNNSNTRSGLTNKVSCNNDITNSNTEQRQTNTCIWRNREKKLYLNSFYWKKDYTLEKWIQCELTALYHMQEYCVKMNINLVWSCTKISKDE